MDRTVERGRALPAALPSQLNPIEKLDLLDSCSVRSPINRHNFITGLT
jgi:hypothetical protein